MKKRVMIFLLVMMLLLSTAVYAIEPRYSVSSPSLSISNSVATCTFRFSADDATDKIDVTLRLYRGQTLVASWPASDYGSIYMKKTANAVSGATYQLTANVSVNGNSVGSNSVTKYY